MGTTESIAVDKIDLSERRFDSELHLDAEELQLPIVLWKHKDSYLVVTGWQTIRKAQNAQRVNAEVLPKDTSEKALFRTVFEKRGLGPTSIRALNHIWRTHLKNRTSRKRKEEIKTRNAFVSAAEAVGFNKRIANMAFPVAERCLGSQKSRIKKITIGQLTQLHYPPEEARDELTTPGTTAFFGLPDERSITVTPKISVIHREQASEKWEFYDFSIEAQEPDDKKRALFGEACPVTGEFWRVEPEKNDKGEKKTPPAAELQGLFLGSTCCLHGTTQTGELLLVYIHCANLGNPVITWLALVNDEFHYGTGQLTGRTDAVLMPEEKNKEERRRCWLANGQGKGQLWLTLNPEQKSLAKPLDVPSAFTKDLEYSFGRVRMTTTKTKRHVGHVRGTSKLAGTTDSVPVPYMEDAHHFLLFGEPYQGWRPAAFHAYAPGKEPWVGVVAARDDRKDEFVWLGRHHKVGRIAVGFSTPIRPPEVHSK